MNNQAGITRINIISDWSDWRTRMAIELQPTANIIYREIFNNIGIPLLDGEEKIGCSKDEAMARYDWAEGIDCILRFHDGTKATLQEKFLDFWIDTITFEEAKSSGLPGAWYYCTAQYYFVGYAREYKDKGLLNFDSWILIDLPGLHRISGTLPWEYNTNGRDGRRAKFRYLAFWDVPESYIIAINSEGYAIRSQDAIQQKCIYRFENHQGILF